MQCNVVRWDGGKSCVVQGIEARDMSQAVMDDVLRCIGRDGRSGLDTIRRILFLNFISAVMICPSNVLNYCQY